MFILILQAVNVSLLLVDLILPLTGVFGSLFLIWLMSALMPVEATVDLLSYVCPLNIVTRHPQNLVNVSSSGEDCKALQAMAT